MRALERIKKIINKEEAAVLLIFLLFAFGFNIYRVQGDGKLYYALLEKTLKIPDPESSTKHLLTQFDQSGGALFNIPFYAAGYALEKVMDKKPDFNGITFRTASINVASNFYMILSIILIFRILKLLNLRKRMISILCVLFSTSAFVAAVIMPSYSHAVDIFLITLFIYLMVKYEGEEPHRLFWLGALYPITIIVRYFNFVLIVPIMVKLLFGKKYKNLIFILLGVLSTVWIIPFLFRYYNTGPYLSEENVLFLNRVPWYPKYALKLLVHPIHGLFVWSPVTILSALGLVKMTDKNRSKGLMFLSMWTLLVLVYGFFYDWHAGWSFSNRYLVGLFPIYVIGLSVFLDAYGKKAIYFSALFTSYSLFLFFNWYICVFHGQWGTPMDMVSAWITGESPDFLGHKVTIKIFLKRIMELCRYKHIIKLFI